MAKKKGISKFKDGGTIFPYENVSHTLDNKERTKTEIHFNYSSHYLTMKGEQREKFIKEYEQFLDEVERLYL